MKKSQVELPPERTGYVRVTFTSGNERYLQAGSFGKAAKQIQCGFGVIQKFDWISEETYLANTPRKRQEAAGATKTPEGVNSTGEAPGWL